MRVGGQRPGGRVGVWDTVGARARAHAHARTPTRPPTRTHARPPSRTPTHLCPRHARMRARADEYKIQQLTSSGVFTHSEARRDTVLAVNYPLVAKYAQYCSDLARKEEEEGILSEAFLGCPFAPCRMHSQQVVEGDKPRVVANLRGPHWGEEDNSTNAGIAF